MLAVWYIAVQQQLTTHQVDLICTDCRVSTSECNGTAYALTTPLYHRLCGSAYESACTSNVHRVMAVINSSAAAATADAAAVVHSVKRTHTSPP
jgi:spermidine synthase